MSQDSKTDILTRDMSYKPFGPLANLTFGNGLAFTKSFDPGFSLTGMSTDGLQDLVITPNADGHITAITDRLDPAKSQSFAYDDLNRLREATGIYGNLYYTYDPVGNRKTFERNNKTDTYSYINGTNIIDEITGTVTKKFMHDQMGNVLQTTRQNALQGPDVKTEYLYDMTGRRIKETINDQTIHYLYDLAGNLIAESDKTGTLSKTFMYAGSTRLARMDSSNEIYYYHTNHLEAPVIMTDQNRKKVWEADYKPFGKAFIAPKSAIENKFRFPGQYYDSATGYHYNWHRYYDPDTGRYLTPDPIGLAGGINPFVYSYNNPVNFIDPFGLWGDNVHYGSPNSNYGTYTWAVQSGFSDNAAHLIGQRNNSVDHHYATGFLPGSQNRHFNTFKDDGRLHEYFDSRLFHAEKEFQAALALFRQGYEDQALGRLGKGLHSLQDYFAHRDWNPGPLGLDAHPSWYDDWDNLKNKCATEGTEEATKAYLKRFIDNAYLGRNY